MGKIADQVHLLHKTYQEFPCAMPHTVQQEEHFIQTNAQRRSKSFVHSESQNIKPTRFYRTVEPLVGKEHFYYESSNKTAMEFYL